MLKRGFDIILSTLLLLALAIPMAAVAVLVWAAMGRPVLFRQERLGAGERPFVIVKFRTMRLPAKDGPAGDAHRITRLGAFLRGSSLDELPTLWNVLKGEMSLVGPRPLPVAYLDRFVAGERRRHEVRPGITGLAQVSGRNALSWAEQLDLDVAYVDTRSARLDLAILRKTVGVVLSGKGARQPGHATRSELRPPG